MGTHVHTTTDWVDRAEALALANNGRLPTTGDLRRDPGNPDTSPIRRDADTILSITRANPRSRCRSETYIRLRDRVREAEAIAQENGGKLPSAGKLQATHPALTATLYRRPEAFAHLDRERTRQYKRRFEAAEDPVRAARSARKSEALDRAVAEAEGLARSHGGSLEITRVFLREHPRLTMQIRRHPELFAHIPRKLRHLRSTSEWVRYAEALAQGNGGLLPSVAELKRSHGGLRNAMARSPEAFAHLPKRRKIVTTPEYVDLAQGIAEQHGGTLPTQWWLIGHGYRNLAAAIHRSPKAFAGIPQHRGKMPKNRPGEP